MDSVALVEYEGNLEKAFEEGIRLIGGFGVLNYPFIIKPNICIGVDKTGFANTRVEMVEALIKLVKEEGVTFTERLLNQYGIAVVPGEPFYGGSVNAVRLSLVAKPWVNGDKEWVKNVHSLKKALYKMGLI